MTVYEPTDRLYLWLLTLHSGLTARPLKTSLLTS